MVTVLLSLLLLLPLAGCGEIDRRQKFVAYEYRYFDTVTQVVGYAETKEEFDAVCATVFARLESYHKAFDIYYSYSTPAEGAPLSGLRDVNRAIARGQTTVAVSDTLYDLLEFSLRMHEATSGRTNVAMGAVLKLWHDCRADAESDPLSARLPRREALLDAARHVDIGCVTLKDGTVTVTDPALSFDVGAIAKGYAAERIAEELEDAGITGYLLNLGGNVRAVGAPPGGTWTVGIENPDQASEQAYVAYLSISDGAVVISGSYQRYYVVDGKRYHHIIDPDTLMPEDRYRSVAVVAEDSGMGDAFSTALFNLDLSAGMALVEQTPGIEAFWVLPDGTTHQSSGFEDFVKK